ncbi:hypothetical protein [Azospirillum sp. sgz301742]
MAKTIVALYDTPAEADAAAQDIRATGFTDLEVELIRHSGYGGGEGYGEVMPQLLGWGVPHDEAIAYAEGLRRGGALLVISPQDDDATARAVTTLEHRRPVDLAERSAEWRASGWTGDPPAPMPKPITTPSTTDADRNLGDAAEALRVSNAEAVPPPPPHSGTASPSFQPASAADVARQRLDREDPERRS